MRWSPPPMLILAFNYMITDSILRGLIDECAERQDRSRTQDRTARPEKILRRQGRARWRRPRRSDARRVRRRHRRIGHRQVGHVEMHSGTAVAGRRQRSRSTARMSRCCPAGRGTSGCGRKIGMLFQGCGVVRFPAGLGERRLRPCRAARTCRNSEAREIALGKLAQVGLGPDVGELSPAELSGGMKKRVGPGPGHRDGSGDHPSSTSRRPAWTRSWAT